MKRIICFAAAMLLAVILTGCTGNSTAPEATPKVTETAARVTGLSTVAPDATRNPAPAPKYDNSVKIVEGTVSGSRFNWEFFVGKSNAGKPASITIIKSEGDKDELMTLDGVAGSYTFRRASTESVYSALVRFTSGESDIFVLCNDPSMTAESFFGGGFPDNARVGDTTDAGVVVFTDYR